MQRSRRAYTEHPRGVWHWKACNGGSGSHWFFPSPACSRMKRLASCPGARAHQGLPESVMTGWIRGAITLKPWKQPLRIPKLLGLWGLWLAGSGTQKPVLRLRHPCVLLSGRSQSQASPATLCLNRSPSLWNERLERAACLVSTRGLQGWVGQICGSLHGCGPGTASGCMWNSRVCLPPMHWHQPRSQLREAPTQPTQACQTPGQGPSSAALHACPPRLHVPGLDTPCCSLLAVQLQMR